MNWPAGSNDRKRFFHFLHFVWLFPSILLFVVALSRRPNFDEWLALRAGWLIANGESSGLHFLMPFTWLVGMLATQFSDVAIPVVLFRFLVTTTVLGVLWWALRRQLDDAVAAGIALFLCLVSGVFVSHAIEFRYDAVILVLWLWCLGITAGEMKEREFLLLGIACALLALHHTKGLFYAAGLGLYVLMAIRFQFRQLAYFLGGAMSVGAIWLLILLHGGLVVEQAGIYRQFSSIALDAPRVLPWDALKERVSADGVWWLVVGSAAAVGFARRVFCGREVTISFFLMLPALFIMLHPRPWDYLIVPLIPPLSVLAVEGYLHVARKLPGRVRNLAPFLLVPTLLISVAGVYAQSLQASGSDDLRLLREISRELRDGDTVIDPVGAVFFVPAFDEQWYLDTLFRNPLQEGTWMKRTAADFRGATMVVASYRLGWIEEAAAAGLSGKYEHVCRWLWMKPGDDRIPWIRARCNTSRWEELLSFWGR